MFVAQRGVINMASVHDVAAYILKENGAMTAMKLQKLVYYSQAWSLVWDEKPLFDEKIVAWANGPVVSDLYTYHRGQFAVQTWLQGNPSKLLPKQKETIEAVTKYYNPYTAQQLSDLTHREEPWIKARKGLEASDRGYNEITIASMHNYYSGLNS